MEPSSLNPQAALNLQLPAMAGAAQAQGARQAEAAVPAVRPAAAGNAQPPSSTYVTISGAGRSRLAEEQATQQVAATAVRESVTVAQNTPVFSRQEGASVNRTPDSMMQTSAPNAPDLARTAVGTATPALGAVASLASSPTPPTATAETPAPAAAQSPAVQQQVRQVDAAQSRQDSPSALAQSGLMDNRKVLSG